MNTITAPAPTPSKRLAADLDTLIEDLTNLRRQVGGKVPVRIPGNVSSIPLLRIRASAVGTGFPVHLTQSPGKGPCVVLLGA